MVGGSNILPTGTFTKGNTCATVEKGTACTSGTMETNTKETGHEESRVALGATPFKTKICFMVRWKDGICRARVRTDCFFCCCLVVPLGVVLVVLVPQANGNGVENMGWVFLKSTSF